MTITKVNNKIEMRVGLVKLNCGAEPCDLVNLSDLATLQSVDQSSCGDICCNYLAATSGIRQLATALCQVAASACPEWVSGLPLDTAQQTWLAGLRAARLHETWIASFDHSYAPAACLPCMDAVNEQGWQARSDRPLDAAQ